LDPSQIRGRARLRGPRAHRRVGLWRPVRTGRDAGLTPTCGALTRRRQQDATGGAIDGAGPTGAGGGTMIPRAGIRWGVTATPRGHQLGDLPFTTGEPLCGRRVYQRQNGMVTWTTSSLFRTKDGGTGAVGQRRQPRDRACGRVSNQGFRQRALWHMPRGPSWPHSRRARRPSGRRRRGQYGVGPWSPGR